MSLTNLTKVIQEHVGTHPDGLWGPKTARAVIDALNIQDNYSAPVYEYQFEDSFRQTPNYSRGTIIKPHGVVLHHSCGSFVGTVSWCLNPVSKVSYHCVIDTDGNRVTLAKDYQRAWHAGKSSFHGRQDCNGFMLGLSFTGDTNHRELNELEIASAVEWIKAKAEEWNWPKDWSTVTTHRFIAPNRKDDVSAPAEKQILDALKKNV